MRHERHGSSCALCPLNGQPRVQSSIPDSGVAHSRIVLLGEAPAGAEVARGEPFIGPSGSLLTLALSRADIRRDRCWIANVTSCRFRNDDATQETSHGAVDACAPGLRKELEAAWRAGYRVIAAMGNTAAMALGIPGKISAMRGSVCVVDASTGLPPFTVVPTFHPAAIPRFGRGGSGKADPLLTLISDFDKVRKCADGTWTPIVERFTLEPTFLQVRDALDEIAETRALIGADIETDGLSRYYGKIVCIGLAKSDSEAIVVPVRVRARDDYYFSEREAAMLKPYWDRALKLGRFIFQNAAFDAPYLRHEGYELPVGSIEHDTYLLHSNVCPEEEHNLGYITSVFGRTPYWKDDFKNRPGSIYQMDKYEMWAYNARDSTVLHQVTPPMLERARELGVLEVYTDETMPLFRTAIIEMQETGVGFDYGRLDAFTKVLDDLIADAGAKIREEALLPPEFDIGNSALLSWFLYDFKPSWHESTPVEYAKRQDAIFKVEAKLESLRRRLDGTKMRETTREKAIEKALESLDRQSSAKTLALWRERKALYDTVRPLYVPSSWNVPLTEKGGVPATDKAALLSLRLKLQNDLSERDERCDKHEQSLKALFDEGRYDTALYRQREDQLRKATEESLAIQRVLDFLEGVEEYAQWEKLRDAFTKYKPAPDGRIHPWWNAGGAATGRLSCRGPNLMQLPKGNPKEPLSAAYQIRKFFHEDDGDVYTSADFENGEVALFGWETGDDIIIEAYDKQLNLHDINTRTLFGIDETSALWAPGRAAAKIAQFARYQYGGGLRSVHRQLVLKAPKLNLTYAKWQAADDRWWAAHPNVKAWDERLTKEIEATRMVYNEFGRMRMLLGNGRDIARAGKNFRVQSALASIINKATLRILARRDAECPGARLIMQVHDQLVFKSSPKDAPVVLRIMAEELERPFLYKGVERALRVGLEWGPSFGELYEVEGNAGAVPDNYAADVAPKAKERHDFEAACRRKLDDERRAAEAAKESERAGDSAAIA